MNIRNIILGIAISVFSFATVFGVDMTYPLIHKSFVGRIAAGTLYNYGEGEAAANIIFHSEFGPRYTGGKGSKVHQGLDLASAGIFTPIMAVESGNISGLIRQLDSDEDAANIWQISFKPNGAGRGDLEWVYMHIITSLSDYKNSENEGVRSWLYLKNNNGVDELVCQGVNVSIDQGKLTDAWFMANYPGYEHLNQTQKDKMRTYFKKPSYVNGIIKNIKNTKMKKKGLVDENGTPIPDNENDLHSVYGYVIVRSAYVGNDNNKKWAIVFFGRNANGFYPIRALSADEGKINLGSDDYPHLNGFFGS